MPISNRLRLGSCVCAPGGLTKHAPSVGATYTYADCRHTNRRVTERDLELLSCVHQNTRVVGGQRCIIMPRHRDGSRVRRRDGHGGVRQRGVRIHRRPGHGHDNGRARCVRSSALDVHGIGESHRIGNRLRLGSCVCAPGGLTKRAPPVSATHTHADRRRPNRRGAKGDLELSGCVYQDARVVGGQRGVVVLGDGDGPGECGRDGHCRVCQRSVRVGTT